MFGRWKWAGTAAAVAMVFTAPLRAQHLHVDRYIFHISLPDTGETVRVTAGVDFTYDSGATGDLALDLVGMVVDSVGWRRDPYLAGYELTNPVPTRYAYDGRVLRIPLDQSLTGGGQRTAVIRYHGVPSDGLMIRKSARGRRVAFGDNWPQRARHWLATIDDPSAKAKVVFRVQGPAEWELVANGSAPRVQQQGWWFWEEHRPIPTYTMVIGAGRFSISTHRPVIHDSVAIPIQVWTYPEDSAFADSGPFKNATEIVEILERIVGPFPYEKLAHVESSTRYGGMENSSAIFYAEEPYVRRTMREGVVRHETSHQWFGDAVTERDWHHLWLSEGFASYFDLVVGAALHGDSVLAHGMQDDAAEYFKSDVVNRAIIDTTTDDPNKLLNANVYPKGAWVLHMLREQIGDSAFFQGIRVYYRRYRDSTALSSDFQQVMERVSGQRLNWFFQQWLRQPGYPQLTDTWTYDGASRSLTVHVRQTQPEAWGLFTLPALVLQASGADQDSARRVRRTIAIHGRDLTARFTVPFVPTGVALDPDGRLLMTSNQAH